MDKKLNEDLIYVQSEVSTTLSNQMLAELNFRGGFNEFYLTLTAKLAKKEELDREQIEITKILWDSKKPGPNKSFEVEYTKTFFYSKEKIKTAYSEYLQSVGCKLLKCGFTSGKSPYITLVIEAPSELRRKLSASDFEMRNFEYAIKDQVPDFRVTLRCILCKK